MSSGPDLNLPWVKKIESGILEKMYTSKSCYGCEQKSKCTSSKSTRRITRWEHEEILEQLAEKMREHPKNEPAKIVGGTSVWNDENLDGVSSFSDAWNR